VIALFRADTQVCPYGIYDLQTRITDTVTLFSTYQALVWSDPRSGSECTGCLLRGPLAVTPGLSLSKSQPDLRRLADR